MDDKPTDHVFVRDLPPVLDARPLKVELPPTPVQTGEGEDGHGSEPCSRMPLVRDKDCQYPPPVVTHVSTAEPGDAEEPRELKHRPTLDEEPIEVAAVEMETGMDPDCVNR